MEAIVLVIHLILVVSLVLIILIQRTGSDGLSGLGGGSSGNALFSVRGKANILTHITSFLAIGFLTTSLILAYIATHKSTGSLVDELDTKTTVKELTSEEKAKIANEFNQPQTQVPATEPTQPAPATSAPAAPAAPVQSPPATPEVPLAR